MSRSIASSGGSAGRGGRRFRRAPAASLCVVLSLGVGTTAGAGTALANPHSPGVSGVATVAALAPSLTAGRGAAVPFVEQEAENAETNGTIISPDRTWFTLASEASGRSAVQLTKPGDYVDFTLTQDANAINVRYAIPDAPNGGGITAPLNVSVDGLHTKTMTPTSQYS
jgi:hypothetical protein